MNNLNGMARRLKNMSISKDDILEALGLETHSSVDWMGPAIIGFGVGALVGAAVALLVAPKAGTELREDLMNRGREYVNKAKEQVNNMTGNSGSTIERPST
jgi:hypothetical protein